MCLGQPLAVSNLKTFHIGWQLATKTSNISQIPFAFCHINVGYQYCQYLPASHLKLMTLSYLLASNGSLYRLATTLPITIS